MGTIHTLVERIVRIEHGVDLKPSPRPSPPHNAPRGASPRLIFERAGCVGCASQGIQAREGETSQQFRATFYRPQLPGRGVRHVVYARSCRGNNPIGE